MAKRINVTLNTYSVANLEQADATLARIAEIKRTITMETAVLDEAIAKVTLEVSDKLSDSKKELEGLEQALAAFAVENRKTLFTDSKKTVVLNFGSFGITTNPPSVDTIGSTTQEQVIQMLIRDGMRGYIRTEDKLDKEALKGCEADFLKKYRLKIKQGEQFSYKCKESGLDAV